MRSSRCGKSSGVVFDSGGVLPSNAKQAVNLVYLHVSAALLDVGDTPTLPRFSQEGMASGELMIGVLDVNRHWSEEASVRCGGGQGGGGDGGGSGAESVVLLPERSMRVRMQPDRPERSCTPPSPSTLSCLLSLHLA